MEQTWGGEGGRGGEVHSWHVNGDGALILEMAGANFRV